MVRPNWELPWGPTCSQAMRCCDGQFFRTRGAGMRCAICCFSHRRLQLIHAITCRVQGKRWSCQRAQEGSAAGRGRVPSRGRPSSPWTLSLGSLVETVQMDVSIACRIVSASVLRLWRRARRRPACAPIPSQCALVSRCASVCLRGRLRHRHIIEVSNPDVGEMTMSKKLVRYMKRRWTSAHCSQEGTLVSLVAFVEPA